MLIMKLVACQRRKTVSKVGLKICFRNFWDLKFWRNENCETYMSAIIFKVLDALILLRKTIQNWRMEPSCPWDLQLWMKNWEKSQISFIMNILSTIRSKFGFAIWLRWNSNLPRHINIKKFTKTYLPILIWKRKLSPAVGIYKSSYDKSNCQKQKDLTCILFNKILMSIILFLNLILDCSLVLEFFLP